MESTISITNHLHKIHTFAVIIESGSLHSASRKLGVSQPALTQTIKILEKATSTQLVHRSRIGVELTPSGKIFYEAVLRILKEVNLLDLDLNADHYEVRQRLRVGIFESIAIYAWPQVQERLRKSFRLAEQNQHERFIELHTGRTDQLLERLNTGDIDVAIAVDPDVQTSQCREHLFDDSFYLYCSPQDPAKNDYESDDKARRKIDRPLFLFENARVNKENDLLSTYMKSSAGSKKNFETLNRVDSFEVATEFVRAGLGFAFLPERVASRNTTGLYKVKPHGKAQPQVGSHRIFAVAPKSVSVSVSFKLLCDAFRAV